MTNRPAGWPSMDTWKKTFGRPLTLVLVDAEETPVRQKNVGTPYDFVLEEIPISSRLADNLPNLAIEAMSDFSD